LTYKISYGTLFLSGDSMMDRPVDRNRFYTNGGKTRRHGLPQQHCGRHFLYKFPHYLHYTLALYNKQYFKAQPAKIV